MPMLGKLTLLDRMLALLIVVSALLVAVLALMGLLVAVVVVGVWLMVYSKFVNLELVNAKS